MALRSIAHLPGRIDSEEFQRYFLYLLEQVRRCRYTTGAMLLLLLSGRSTKLHLT